MGYGQWQHDFLFPFLYGNSSPYARMGELGAQRKFEAPRQYCKRQADDTHVRSRKPLKQLWSMRLFEAQFNSVRFAAGAPSAL